MLRKLLASAAHRDCEQNRHAPISASAHDAAFQRSCDGPDPTTTAAESETRLCRQQAVGRMLQLELAKKDGGFDRQEWTSHKGTALREPIKCVGSLERDPQSFIHMSGWNKHCGHQSSWIGQCDVIIAGSKRC